MSGDDGTGVSSLRTFAQRQGLAVPRLPRESAPVAFRHSVVGALKQAITFTESVVATIQRCAAVPRPTGVMSDLVMREMIEACEWWRVFDIAEAGWKEAAAQPLGGRQAEGLERAVNEACVANGLGWRMESGEFRYSTSDEEERRRTDAFRALETSAAKTAAHELDLAHACLSRRPEADATGAVQHAGAALETFGRRLSGKSGLTFGAIVAQFPDLIPKALRKLVDTAWGAISNNGRHLQDGGAPTLADAALLVGLAELVIAYMGRNGSLLELGSADG